MVAHRSMLICVLVDPFWNSPGIIRLMASIVWDLQLGLTECHCAGLKCLLGLVITSSVDVLIYLSDILIFHAKPLKPLLIFFLFHFFSPSLAAFFVLLSILLPSCLSYVLSVIIFFIYSTRLHFIAPFVPCNLILSHSSDIINLIPCVHFAFLCVLTSVP